MSDFFKTVKVVPYYGQKKAVLFWDVVDLEEINNTFHIYRSENGLDGFKRIGQTNELFFEDTDFIPKGNQTDTYFRVAVQKNGQLIQSDTVATFGEADRLAFGMSAVIVQQEYQQMRLNKPVVYAKLRVGGEPCPDCSDEQTGVALNSSRCTGCYGTTYAGGFWPGVSTYMRKIASSKRQVDDEQGENLGSVDKEIVRVRMLAIPVLHKGDMLVEPDSDRRYLVDTLTPFLVAGKYPVLQDIDLTIVPRNDMRYHFSVPR